MKRLIAAAVIVALAGGGWWAWKKKKKRRPEGASKPVAAVVGPIERVVDATGAVAPRNRVEIKPPVGGRIEKLLVDEGDRVKSGQIVAWLSSTDRTAILDAALAQGPEHFQKWQDAYKPTPIVASLPGEIILRNVVVGEAVGTASVLFAVADTMIVTAQVDEADIGKIKQDMRARIRLDSYPDQPVDGKVVDILYEGKKESNVITYGVKVMPDKVPPFFRSQMTANVSFIVERRESAVLLPADAVRGENGRRYVRLPPAEKGAKPEEREVKVGLETDDQVEILEGVAEGEKVLGSGSGYAAQAEPQSSPLSFGGTRMGRRGATEGAAPRPRRSGSSAAGGAAPATPR
jgi:macrolide-specific efflux system membrane fusion protein